MPVQGTATGLVRLGWEVEFERKWEKEKGWGSQNLMLRVFMKQR